MTAPVDISTLLQAESRALTALYERHAYLVYNIALRICCEPAPAAAAARRTFLEVAAAGHDERRVLPAVAAAALASSPGRPRPAGAGDATATAMLALVARLPAQERAALALATLGGAGPAELAAALGASTDAAAALLARARERLAAQLDGDDADAALAAWLWAAPPDELWEALHAEHYRAADARLRASAPGAAADAPRRRGLRRGQHVVVWLSTLILAAAGVATAQLVANGAAVGGGPGSQPGEPATAVAPSPGDRAATVPPIAPTTGAQPAAGAQTAPAAKPLTPAALDKLRLAELADLRRYARRQADRRLTPQQRQAAQREVRRIQELALRRLAAAERKQAQLRRALARERARSRSRERASARKPARSGPAAGTPPRDGASSPPPRQTTTATPTTATPPPQQESGCLYDEQNDSYICPQ